MRCSAGRLLLWDASPPDTKEQFLHHFLSIPGQPGPCSSSPVPLRVLERTQLGLWGRWAGHECWLAGLAPAHSTLVPLLPTLMTQQAGSSAEGSGPPGQGLCTRPTNLHVRALPSAGRAWSLRGAHSGWAPSVATGFLRDLVAFWAGVDATRHWGTGYNVTQGAGVFRGSVLPPELSYF